MTGFEPWSERVDMRTLRQPIGADNRATACRRQEDDAGAAHRRFSGVGRDAGYTGSLRHGVGERSAAILVAAEDPYFTQVPHTRRRLKLRRRLATAADDGGDLGLWG